MPLHLVLGGGGGGGWGGGAVLTISNVYGTSWRRIKNVHL
jgi:hypothetical protein